MMDRACSEDASSNKSPAVSKRMIFHQRHGCDCLLFIQTMNSDDCTHPCQI